MKTNLILGAAAVLLAIPTTCEILEDRGTFTEYEKIPRLFPGFTPGNIQIIELVEMKKGEDGESEGEEPPGGEAGGQAQEAEQLVFVRRDDQWLLGNTELAGVPVMDYRVEEEILDHIQRIRRDKKAVIKVDADDEVLARYHLTEDTGIVIRCRDANQAVMGEMILGSSTSEGKYGEEYVRGYFVRRTDGNDVILYEPPAPGYWSLTCKSRDWIDNKAWEFDTENVSSFTLKNPKGAVTFEKKDGKWHKAEGPEGVGAVRQGEVDQLVSRIGYMSTQGYQGPLANYPDLKELGLDPPKYEVTAKLEDDKVYSVWIGEKLADKNEHHARFNTGPAKDFLCKVGDWDVSAFERDPEELFDPPADAVAPDKEGEKPEEEGDEGEAGKQPGEEKDEEDGSSGSKTDPGKGKGKGKGESKGG